jgi:hypothetical protein
MAQETKVEKQTRLEQEGIQARKEQTIKNDFNKNGEVYNEESDLVKSHEDESHPLGKGTGGSGHGHRIPNRHASKTAIDRSDFDTERGGGSYDIFGMNDAGGRKRSTMINLYSVNYQYNENSIDTSKNVEDGQWINK